LCPLCIAKCDNPELLFTSDSDNATTPRVEGFDDMVPTLEGRTVSFICPPGFVLSGPGSAICSGNGGWEPDPRGIMCNNMSFEGLCTMMNKSIAGQSLYCMHAVSHMHNISLSYRKCHQLTLICATGEQVRIRLSLKTGTSYIIIF
jgi:hypothetical protein